MYMYIYALLSFVGVWWGGVESEGGFGDQQINLMRPEGTRLVDEHECPGGHKHI